MLTACRSCEVRLASWDDINLETAEWTIPGERMKAQRPHRVPLSGRAVEILSEARTLGGGGGLVFPSPEGRVFSDTNLPRLLRGLGIAAVPHGFRSSFRDWAAECTDTPHAVMEAALAHVVRNKAEAAYARSDLFERRRVPDGRLGGLSGRRASRPGGRTGSLIRRARSVGGRVRQALKSGGAKAGSRPVSSHEPAYPLGPRFAGPRQGLARVAPPPSIPWTPALRQAMARTRPAAGFVDTPRSQRRLMAFPLGIAGGERPPAEGGMGVHMPTLRDADRGIPKGGVAPFFGRKLRSGVAAPAAVPQL